RRALVGAGAVGSSVLAVPEGAHTALLDAVEATGGAQGPSGRAALAAQAQARDAALVELAGARGRSGGGSRQSPYAGRSLQEQIEAQALADLLRGPDQRRPARRVGALAREPVVRRAADLRRQLARLVEVPAGAVALHADH